MKTIIDGKPGLAPCAADFVGALVHCQSCFSTSEIESPEEVSSYSLPALPGGSVYYSAKCATPGCKYVAQGSMTSDERVGFVHARLIREGKPVEPDGQARIADFRERCETRPGEWATAFAVDLTRNPMMNMERIREWFACAIKTGADAARAIDAEGASMLKPYTFRCWVMAGAFMETSQRSGITYIFRRLRPTVALKASATGVRVLCGLCLHPIGYYRGTWAGSMTPTDEAIAHLCLMRGDEADFWRQANQHPAYSPQAAIYL